MTRKRARYQEPIAVCSGCGRERRCRGATTATPLCNTCRRNGDGKWTAPVALCTVCERVRPCLHARTDWPICRPCAAADPARREVCASCARLAFVAARSSAGPECPTCRRRRMRTTITCSGCRCQARPSASTPGCCERCAGERVAQVCRGCGAEHGNYADGRCPRCVLRARIENLTRSGDPAAVEALGGYLAAFVATPNASSALNWMTCSNSYETLRELIAGTIPLTHDALDTVDRGMSTIYLREGLVRHGALPKRPTQTAALAAFIARQLPRVPDGPDRLHLHTFATWKVQHDLSQAERRGTARPSSHQVAQKNIRVATDLLLWLAQQKLALQDLHQEHLDYWLADGSGDRRRVRAFIVWAVRAKITGPLTAPAPVTRAHTDPLRQSQRLELLRTLLTDEALDLRDRVAGCLVLLFAQRVSRIVFITIDDLEQRDGQVFLTLGREPLLLPEPLATLTQRLKDSLPTAAVDARSGWLFPGRWPDTHLTEHHLRDRLHRLGLRNGPARTSAAAELGQRLPAAVLADLLGFAENTAERWIQLANGDWTRYAAARATTPNPPRPRSSRRRRPPGSDDVRNAS